MKDLPLCDKEVSVTDLLDQISGVSSLQGLCPVFWPFHADLNAMTLLPASGESYWSAWIAFRFSKLSLRMELHRYIMDFVYTAYTFRQVARTNCSNGILIYV